MTSEHIRHNDDGFEWERRRAHQKALIDAVNLISEEVGNKLPPLWSITLTLEAGGCYMQLTDPEGDDVEFEGGEHCYSAITSACETARQESIQ